MARRSMKPMVRGGLGNNPAAVTTRTTRRATPGLQPGGLQPGPAGQGRHSHTTDWSSQGSNVNIRRHRHNLQQEHSNHDEYSQQGHGIEVLNLGGGYQIKTKPDFDFFVRKLLNNSNEGV